MWEFVFLFDYYTTIFLDKRYFFFCFFVEHLQPHIQCNNHGLSRPIYTKGYLDNTREQLKINNEKMNVVTAIIGCAVGFYQLF